MKIKRVPYSQYNWPYGTLYWLWWFYLPPPDPDALPLPVLTVTQQQQLQQQLQQQPDATKYFFNAFWDKLVIFIIDTPSLL